MSSEQIRGLVSIKLCQLMDQLRSKTGNYLAIFVLSILSISCLPKISKKFYHVTGRDQLSAQHKRRTGNCCLGEYWIRSWSSNSLKLGIPWHFLFISILLISCLPNVSNRIYHGTGDNQLSEEHIGVLVSIKLFQLMDQLQPQTRHPLAMFVLSIYWYYIFPNISNKFYHASR